MARYPYTFDFGPGERFTVLGPVEDEEGTRLEAENVLQPGARVPMHVHYLQEEGFTVLSGRAGYQRAGERARFLGPGENVVFAPGVPHRFWNDGEGELQIRGYMRPPLNSEYFMGEMAKSIQANGGKQPNLLDAAYLMRHYRSEYGLGGSGVLRLVISGLGVLARLTGRHRKYAGAPPPT
jgi:mannose-6-phosphate isomerase-like protein (cupin superfamily)